MSSFIAAEEIRVREKIAFQIKVSFGNTFQEVIIKGSIINFINKFVACDNSLFIDQSSYLFGCISLWNSQPVSLLSLRSALQCFNYLLCAHILRKIESTIVIASISPIQTALHPKGKFAADNPIIFKY